MNKPLIRLESFSISSYPTNGTSVQLVTGINLKIFPNEIFGILGPSGSGKTTLLKAIALLTKENQLSGKYFFNSTQVIPVGPKGVEIDVIRKNIIFIHQSPILFRGTVNQNLRYGINLRNMDTSSTYFEELITSFKLTNLLKRDVRTLSAGEKQRVCLLRAMVIKPQILVLDEPTQNLDPANINTIENNIKLFRDQGGTVVIVTHNLFQAQRIADRTGILVNGQIIEVGETQSLFNAPQNSQTKDFLSGKLIF